MKWRTEGSGVGNETSDTVNANKSIPEAQKEAFIVNGSNDGRRSRRQYCGGSQQQTDHGQ
jgi:hypothetical protein